MYQISKRFDFDSSHQLKGLPENHKCGRVHGHSYSVTVHLVHGVLDNTGFVRDYGELDVVKQVIDDSIDHRHLNDIFNFNPTAENIAKWFYDRFIKEIPELVAVTVKETKKTEAVYSPKFALHINT